MDTLQQKADERSQGEEGRLQRGIMGPLSSPRACPLAMAVTASCVRASARGAPLNCTDGLYTAYCAR